MLSSQKSIVAFTDLTAAVSFGAFDPASSFGSYRSGAGMTPSNAATAFATSSRPQPLIGSRCSGHDLQPFAAFTSVAERSRMFATWSDCKLGLSASSTAAAAVTWGAAKDVPAACRNSSGPQSEYPWFMQSGRNDVNARGSVE